jgi:hypothetical protein
MNASRIRPVGSLRSVTSTPGRVIGTVLSDGRCSIHDPVGIFFQRHDEWFPQTMLFDFVLRPV